MGGEELAGPAAASVSLLLSPHTVVMALCLKVADGLTELGHQFFGAR